MSEREAFIRKIRLEPNEDTHRLVYADWLREHDEPYGHERGAFVAYQFDWEWAKEAHGADWDGTLPTSETEYPLEAQVWPYEEWSDSFASLLRLDGGSYPLHGVRWTRGFIEFVRMPAADFMSNARRLFTAHPITAVELSDKSPHCPGVRTFEFATSKTGRRYQLTSWILPTEFRYFMTGHRSNKNRPKGQLGGITRYRYGTIREAEEACSRAAVDYGRTLVGLPRLYGAPAQEEAR